MTTKNSKQVVKPLYHIGAVIFLTAIFILLNIAGIINASSEVPESISSLLELILSVHSVYTLLFTLLLLMALYVKIKANFSWRAKVRMSFFWVLAFLTGKFYTWAAFFFAWALASEHIDYIHPIPLSTAYGLTCLMLGWVIWWLARTLAAGLWK